MIYRPLNNFMIESSLKNVSWDGMFLNWLYKLYPNINLKNDSNLWEVLKANDDNIVDTYKEIKLFLKNQIESEDNMTRLKNLICTNCFGLNIETVDYLIEEMSKYLNCFSSVEEEMYGELCLISKTQNRDILISCNDRLERKALPIISSIKDTLKTNYKRLLASSINIPTNKFDKSSSGIMVHYLKQEKFQMIVGVISKGKFNSANSYKRKEKLDNYLKKLRNNLASNPGILSANLISDEYIGLFKDGDIIFGYEYLPTKRILGMNTGDCFKKINKKLILDELFYDRPDALLNHVSSNAVEIVVDMQPEPVMPSYIVAIDSISDIDIDVAKKLKLPIYVIDSKCCYEKRIHNENHMINEIEKIEDEKQKLKHLVKLYKYQEQTYFINTGYFSTIKSESTSRLDSTYNKIGKIIKNVYNSCVLDDNLSIKQRFDNMETLILLNTYITDISLANSLSSKRNGDAKNFKCFFTEYSSHSEFMNSIISKIEEKFSSTINTYALICLASLTCKTQDYNLKICYEEFSKQARDYLKYFNFPYIELLETNVFNKIEDFSKVKVYSKSPLSLLFDDDNLECVLYKGYEYKIIFKTSSSSKFNKIKYSYICKNEENEELEIQVLNNDNLKIIADCKIIVHGDELKYIDNKEYAINK